MAIILDSDEVIEILSNTDGHGADLSVEWVPVHLVLAEPGTLHTQLYLYLMPSSAQAPTPAKLG